MVYTQNLLPALIDILLGKIQLAVTVEGSLNQFFGRFCNLNVFAPLVGIVRGRPCVMALYAQMAFIEHALLSNRSFFIKLQSTVTVYSVASSGRSRLLDGPAAKIEISRRTDYVVDNFKRRKSKSGHKILFNS